MGKKLSEWVIQRSQTGEGPWYAELSPVPRPEFAFDRYLCRRHCLFLDSATPQHRLGRYSFLTADPLKWHVSMLDEPSPFKALRHLIRHFHAKRVDELPPFQGGMAGLWSYDLNRSMEQIPPPQYRDLESPAVAVGIYDTVVAWDHQQNRCWVLSHGLSSDLTVSDGELAAERISEVCRRLNEEAVTEDRLSNVDSESWNRRQRLESPSFEVEGSPEMFSNFSREGFLEAVQRGIEYIRAGDIFQVNLAHRLRTPARTSAGRLYRSLRQNNPAPFAGFLDLGESQVVSASPERLVQIRDRVVESRPIKGTTHRTRFPEADLSAAETLRQSEKDRAENIMIVDLLRNDLSKICKADSIQVTQLCEVEPYQYVQHLVSAIRGVLKENADGLDVIEAIFPGGSITGAPKIRAMEIIAELEPTPRGAYCGSLGYIGFDGSCDFNILIRTITAQAGWWSFPVGGGIVYQSSPEKERVETWHKARGLIRGIEAAASGAWGSEKRSFI